MQEQPHLENTDSPHRAKTQKGEGAYDYEQIFKKGHREKLMKIRT